MLALYNLFGTVIDIVLFVLIANAIISWLMAFGIINMSNQFVATIYSILQRFTEPLLRPIRKLIPNLGGLDISPIILILALFFIRDLVYQYRLFG